MGENSKIEWCDHTASPWHGCEKVAAGCDNCYAAQLSLRNPGTLGIWGPDGVRVKSKSFAKNLRLWNSQAEKSGNRVTVFPSLCDPFEDRPELVAWRNEMFAVSDECPWVTLLLLTKRPENVRRMWPAAFPAGDETPQSMWCPVCQSARDRSVCVEAADNQDGPETPESYEEPRSLYCGSCGSKGLPHRSNVWIGTSIATQADADRNISELLKCRDLSPVLFVSAEPLLGPVDVPAGIDWVIVGGESGPGARPMDPRWVRSLRDQCQAAGVPFFFKQWGEHSAECVDGTEVDLQSLLPNQSVAFGDGKTNHVRFTRVGRKAAGRELDGRTWDEFPLADVLAG